MDTLEKQLMDLIGSIEAPLGYNHIYGSTSIHVPLTLMTLDEVIRFQRTMTGSWGSPSSACGKFQIIRRTLKGLMRNMGLDGSVLFDGATQDAMAIELMNGRGLRAFKQGRLTAEEFADNLAKEWASLPAANGKSEYAGDGLNKVLTTRSTVLDLNRHAVRGGW